MCYERNYFCPLSQYHFLYTEHIFDLYPFFNLLSNLKG